MKLISNQEIPIRLRESFFTEAWGSSQMVISSGVYDCSVLEGFSYMEEDEIVGCVTFHKGEQFEVISLDSLKEKQGVGSVLMDKVEEEAKACGFLSVRLLTTNDNLQAVHFYQKRGYRLCEIYLDAVVQARKVKPEIPQKAGNGLPIRDEWLFMKELL